MKSELWVPEGGLMLPAHLADGKGLLPDGMSFEKLGFDGAFVFKAEVKTDGEDEGRVLAKVATTGVVDSQLQIIDENAVKSIMHVDVSDWAHSSMLPVWMMPRPPVGDGKVWGDAEKKGIFLDALIDLESDAGGAMFRRQKRKKDAKAPSYWSIGWRNLSEPVREEKRYQGRRVTVYRLMDIEVGEVSPVFRGASPRTRTIGVKSYSEMVSEDRQQQMARDRAWRLRQKHFRDYIMPRLSA